jgi:hypothetical protein
VSRATWLRGPLSDETAHPGVMGWVLIRENSAAAAASSTTPKVCSGCQPELASGRAASCTCHLSQIGTPHALCARTGASSPHHRTTPARSKNFIEAGGKAFYRTAAAGLADGEPELSSDAWVALVAASDAWTAFRQARGQLFREVKLRDLPGADGSSSARASASQARTVVRLTPSDRAITVSGIPSAAEVKPADTDLRLCYFPAAGQLSFDRDSTGIEWKWMAMLRKVARWLLGRRDKQPPVRLNGTWTDQHARLLRSHRRLKDALANRPEPADVDYDALDALYHFCGDALNLRDWVKTDLPRRHGRAAYRLIKHSKPLSACADIANGSKHLMLRQWYTRKGPAKVSARSVTIYARTARAYAGAGAPVPIAPEETEEGSVQISFEIDAGPKKQYDALDLAEQAVNAWNTWLSRRGLL